MKKLATLAGGCFWCIVKPFKNYEGIEKIVAGYTGGEDENPTYEKVCKEITGHLEAVQITYDDNLVDYEDILDIFWRQIDPTDEGGQFNDRGNRYKTAIFYHDDIQKDIAIKSKEKLKNNNIFLRDIKTEILPAQKFYEAEDYHQDYYKKEPIHYEMYYKGSGRYDFIKNNWDKNNKDREILKNKLSKEQFEITQNDKTEPAFNNIYWDNKEEGIYVDLISGEVLFTSKDKFDSGCGWPSFTKPASEKVVREKSDFSHGMYRVEIRSTKSNAHLGHVFDDGPKESGGLRYCINSSALEFIPKNKMEELGYKDYLNLFD